ncbi:hypothetical protein HerbRD11066_71120 [Herbidospora sp. RD11066]
MTSLHISPGTPTSATCSGPAVWAAAGAPHAIATIMAVTIPAAHRRTVSPSVDAPGKGHRRGSARVASTLSRE